MYYTSLIEKCSDTIIESQNRTTQKIIELATNAESLWNMRSTVEKVLFLKKVVSNPVLEGPTIRYDLQKPFAVIAQMSGNKNWRSLVPRLRTELLEYVYISPRVQFSADRKILM